MDFTKLQNLARVFSIINDDEITKPRKGLSDLLKNQFEFIIYDDDDKTGSADAHTNDSNFVAPQIDDDDSTIDVDLRERCYKINEVKLAQVCRIYPGYEIF